ncbi:MAG: hypothetical protein NTZ44_01920 [Candidatus Nomurabacteria bacterium]|nr:hypothetical protein [Candidatus Nomurabacteria bacterium]
MKKKQLPLVIVIVLLVVPLVAISAWWNPFHWFKKKEIQTPVVQTLVPIVVNDKTVLTSKESSTIQTDSTLDYTTTTAFKNSVFADPGIFPLLDTTIYLSGDESVVRSRDGQIILPVKYDYNQSITAIDTFLLNQTLETFKTFCNKAKELPSIGQKKVLNDTKTDFIMKDNTLYDDYNLGKLCTIALGQDKNSSYYKWTTYSPSYFVTFDNPNESDKARTLKINYNAFWKSLSDYKLIGFDIWQNKDAVTPNQVIDKMVSVNNEALFFTTFNNGFFLVPEKILSSIEGQLKVHNK